MTDKQTMENAVQEALRKLREGGWTISALADKLGLSNHTLYMWTKGRAVYGVEMGLLALGVLAQCQAPPRRKPGPRG